MNAVSPPQIIVDAGFFLRAASGALSHGLVTPSRSEVSINAAETHRLLWNCATGIGITNPHVGWYDGFRVDRPLRQEQCSIIDHPDFTFVAGPLRERGTGRWQQKRVDALLHRDLVAAARSGAPDIFLVAGDEDLAVAAEECASLGSRVWVTRMDVGGRNADLSAYLRAVCHDEIVLSRSDVISAVHYRSRAGIAQVAAASMRGAA